MNTRPVRETPSRTTAEASAPYTHFSWMRLTRKRRTIVSLPERLRGALEEVARDRFEPIRRALEQLEPGARAHFVEGVRILSAEVARPPL